MFGDITTVGFFLIEYAFTAKMSVKHCVTVPRLKRNWLSSVCYVMLKLSVNYSFCWKQMKLI